MGPCRDTGAREDFLDMRRLIAATIIALTAALTIPVGTAHAADPGAEADLVNRINAFRGQNGLPALATHSVLTAKAEAWAQTMANAGTIFHSNLPDGVTVSWRKLGENVGKGGDVASIHQALVNSAPVRWLLGERTPPPTPEATLLARSELEQALSAVNTLPVKERVVFSMCHLGGLTQNEAARVLGHSKGYVSKLLKRAEARLSELGWEVSHGA